MVSIENCNSLILGLFPRRSVILRNRKIMDRLFFLKGLIYGLLKQLPPEERIG